MRMASIASGSSGNSIYIGSDQTHILIDAGISNKRIECGLRELGIEADELSALLITHEHSDHIKGLKVFLKKHRIPVYASPGSLDEIRRMGLAEGFEKLLVPISPECRTRIGDLTIKPFRIDHDAREPFAYRVSTGGKAVAVATDLGHYDEEVVEHLRNLDAVLVEANHDIRMLEAGPYPYHLKRRILSDFGHLSNESAGKLLCRIFHQGLKKIFLGHLSSENNYPSLAYEAVKCELCLLTGLSSGGEIPIEVAKRERLSCVAEV